MGTHKKPKVLLRYNGEEKTLVRLEGGGEKVEVKKGDCYYAEYDRARSISGQYKAFEILQPHDATEKEVKQANKREADKVKEGEVKKEEVKKEKKKEKKEAKE